MHFPLLVTIFFFKKIPCHLVALLKDNAIFNVPFRFRLFYCVYTLFFQGPIFIFNYPLNSSLFGIKIKQQHFLKTSITLWRIHIPLGNVSSTLAHIPQILHHMHWPPFPLDSKNNINNSPSLTIFKICLGQHLLCVSDVCEGLSPMLLITSLSKDKVPSKEKPYADFISSGNVNKLSPIESIKTKRCLILGT